MAILLGWKDVKAQSDSVFKQFGESVWIPNANINAKLERGDISKFKNIGVGKLLLCCAMGESLERNIDTVKKHREKYDIVTCDKGFRALLEHGVKADFVILCDANIVYDKWIGDSIKETKGVSLLATPYANTDWTTQWLGDRYFFINKDSIESEKIFLKIFGDNTRVIPAGSNVGNAMLIFFTGVDETTIKQYSGYEAYLLLGYDYSWKPDGNYYAWSNPQPKRYYMNHRTMLDMNNDVINSSENLLFSAKWLYSYITSFNLPVVNCSGSGLLDIPAKANLENYVTKMDTSKTILCRNKFTHMQKIQDEYIKAKNEFEAVRISMVN